MQRNFYATKVYHIKTASTMVLMNRAHQKRIRKMVTLSRLQRNGVDSDLLIRFRAPLDITGTAFLQIQHSGRPDDEWIYLPALHRTRRLVADDKADSFVGSDFSYGDLMLPKVSDYKNTRLPSQSVNGIPCYVIVSTPINAKVERHYGYSKKITWVRKDNFVEKKVEYFDRRGALLKTQTIDKDRLVDPKTHRWFAMYRKMINDQTGHVTIITFSHVVGDKPIPRSAFTTRQMVYG